LRITTAIKQLALNPQSQEANNTEWAINHMLSNGLSKKKLVLAFAAYGMLWKTQDSGERIEADLPDQSSEVYIYPEICQQLTRNKWKKVWSEEQNSPYAFKDQSWIKYEDPQSLFIKVKLHFEPNLFINKKLISCK
jgi:GH18 family chitinase